MWDGDIVCCKTMVQTQIVLSPPCGMETVIRLAPVEPFLCLFCVLSPPCGMETSFPYKKPPVFQGSKPTVWDGDNLLKTAKGDVKIGGSKPTVWDGDPLEPLLRFQMFFAF